MDDLNRRFTSDEVSAIVRRALGRQNGSHAISYADLEDIARQSGISASHLHQAIAEEERFREREQAKAKWHGRRKATFFYHLRAYCIINGFLFLVNVITDPGGYLWVVWPVLGWGIGLAFHLSATFFPHEQKVERGTRRLLRRQKQRQAGEKKAE
ncbi:hypothetical protein NKDENANG_01906 [Candidatus Entotheonellaceae bacterium PAL068K]